MAISSSNPISICVIFCTLAAVICQIAADDNCMECTMKIETVLQSLCDSLKDRDPMELDTPDPCNKCSFGGVAKTKLNGEVCSQKVQVDGKNCYDHKLNFVYDEVTVNCSCELPFNPADVAKMAAGSAQDPGKGIKCTEKGQTPIDPEKLAAESAKQAAGSNPMELMKMAECQPPVPSMPKMGAKPPPKTVKGGIFATYKNFKISIVLRSCGPGEKVQTQEITLDESSTKDCHTDCTGEKDYMAPCNCFAKTNFINQITTTVMTTIFPCYGDSQMSKNADLIQNLCCNELV